MRWGAMLVGATLGLTVIVSGCQSSPDSRDPGDARSAAQATEGHAEAGEARAEAREQRERQRDERRLERQRDRLQDRADLLLAREHRQQYRADMRKRSRGQSTTWEQIAYLNDEGFGPVARILQRGLSRCPYPGVVKGNLTDDGELIYHLRGWKYYALTYPEECFIDQEMARERGYRPSKVR